MDKIKSTWMYMVLMFALLFVQTSLAQAMVKGIYITQGTLEDTKEIKYLISRSKNVGIHTFIVDLELPSAQYEKNIQLLKQNNINYIARIIIFPNNGGKPSEVLSEAYWEKKYKLVKK